MNCGIVDWWLPEGETYDINNYYPPLGVAQYEPRLEDLLSALCSYSLSSIFLEIPISLEEHGPTYTIQRHLCHHASSRIVCNE